MSNFIDNQLWRYSAKKYDPSRNIAQEHLSALKEAIRLSTSSYGLQPYKVLIIEKNVALREELKLWANGQSPITDAAVLFVFANDVDFTEASIDLYIENISATRGIPLDEISGYGQFMKSKLMSWNADERAMWSSRQTYLALGNLINAAAELKIDVTPMEGFDVSGFNKTLNLDQLGLNASVIAAIGYRHAEDASQHHKKVRKSTEELFINL